MELEAIKTVLDLAVKPHMDSLSRALETLTQEVKGLRSGLDHMKGEREGAKHEDRIAELERRLRMNESMDAEQATALKFVLDQLKSEGKELPAIIMKTYNNLQSGEGASNQQAGASITQERIKS